MEYLQLQNNDLLPNINNMRPFKCVLVSEVPVSPEWQAKVSEWLVNSGCLYMLAWGNNCSSWDDSVDVANLERFEYQEIPAESFVITTWHENESLSEVFEFCKKFALHEVENLENTLLLHISTENKFEVLTSEYKSA
jgi:hypothetical protein